MILYHATNLEAAGQINQSGFLFGLERLQKETTCMGMTLTSDESAARILARPSLTNNANNHLRIIITFDVPDELIATRGRIGEFDVEEFSTNDTVAASTLPETYLEKIHLPRRTAIEREKKGEIRFYRLGFLLHIAAEIYTANQSFP